jgi:hypothetical protein
MGRVGRPFKGRQREEERRATRAARAQGTPRRWVRYTINVEEGSDIAQTLGNKSNVSDFIRGCIRDNPSLNREVQELRRTKNNLQTQLETWETEIHEYRHALGLHSEKPAWGCPACK